MLTFVLFFAFATSSMMFILGKSVFSDLKHFNHLVDSKRAYMISESLTEDVVYRLVYGIFDLDETEVLTFDGVTAISTSSLDVAADIYSIDTASSIGVVWRKSYVELAIGSGSSFNYGLQAGNGGIHVANSASIIGNVYANGPVTGAGSATIYGDVVSAGPAGYINDIYATGTVYANTIEDIEADGDAYYETALGSNTISGTSYATSSNLATTSFPISTTTIQEWKDAVADYGTVIASTDPACSSGTYTIDTSLTIGYLKVECNLDIRKTGPSTVITLDGPIWVEGDLSFTQGPDIEVDSSLGRRSVQFIVDNESDRLTSSRVEIRNSTNFTGSGDYRSYIMLLSMNESAESSGSEIAIDVSQSANGAVVAYAPSGLIEIGNGIDLREITGYQINIAQNTDVIYEEGLASLLFTSGPGGEYILDEWRQGR